ncbi:hypothetical protein ACDX78_22930 [Virgibacillus oceani]
MEQRLCQRCKGKAVEIRTHDGARHRGVINHVDNHKVYLHPFDHPRQLGGFGFGFGGAGFSGLGGAGLGFASIAAIPCFHFFSSNGKPYTLDKLSQENAAEKGGYLCENRAVE